jgi:hypothetical protein
MKKLIITIITSFALTSVSYAGSFGIGVSGSLAKVSADGTETTDAGTVGGGAANTNTKSVDELGMIGSIFLDYEFDGLNGLVIGFSHVPGSADVTGSKHSRTENAQGTSGADADGLVVRTADAEVENFNTLYVEYPVGPIYAKLGFSQIDVNTLENTITDSGTYGNATLDGYTVGAGMNGSFAGLFTKTSVEYTDFEDLSLNSSSANKITADLDVLEFKIAVGKRF